VGGGCSGSPTTTASTIEELLGGIPLAGFFAAGEIGPIAGRNALHGFTASMALFTEDQE
jgi:small ligand-binding sensory domain FIST